MLNNTSTETQTAGEWLRGYNKHTYWVGPTKKAEIACGRRPDWNGNYAWHLTESTIRGNSPSLVEARQGVEMALRGIYQLDFFGFEPQATDQPAMRS